MKITIKDILTFMRNEQNINISEEQEHEIKDHFYKPVRNLVYWSFKESNRYFDKTFEGTIKKEFYKYLQTLDKKQKYSFGEVIDNLGEVLFTIEELEFNEEPEVIVSFLTANCPNDYILKDCFIEAYDDKYDLY
jgi:hypothetical protein